MTLYIYDIKSLNYKDISEVFESVGPCKIVNNPHFAVVDYLNGQHANIAFEKFQNYEIKG